MKGDKREKYKVIIQKLSFGINLLIEALKGYDRMLEEVERFLSYLDEKTIEKVISEVKYWLEKTIDSIYHDIKRDMW